LAIKRYFSAIPYSSSPDYDKLFFIIAVGNGILPSFFVCNLYCVCSVYGYPSGAKRKAGCLQMVREEVIRKYLRRLELLGVEGCVAVFALLDAPVSC